MNLIKIADILVESLIKANGRVSEVLYVFIKQLIETFLFKNEKMRFKGIKSSYLVVTNGILLLLITYYFISRMSIVPVTSYLLAVVLRVM